MANLAMTGRTAEARVAYDAALQADPTLRISNIQRKAPFRRRQDIEKLSQAYRIAGVPE